MARNRFPIDKEKGSVETLAQALARHQYSFGSQDDYYDLKWHLRRLDQYAILAAEQGKFPAAVAAQRTMMEAVQLLGPQIAIDAHTEVLQLPEGLSEAALIALATGSYVDSEAEHVITDIVRSDSEQG